MTRPVVLVTGASRGIGATTARLFASNGYAVGVNYRNDADAAHKVVGEICGNSGNALALQADVSIPDEVESMFSHLDARLGTLKVLVNNAGIVGPRCRIEDLAYADLQHILAINVSGPILCSQQAIARMSTRHGGAGGSGLTKPLNKN